MNTRNCYESLRIDCVSDMEPVEAQSTWRVTERRDENITIFSSLLSNGLWVYGYMVNWANGRTSIRKPTAELGLFRTQREAKLYAIGFMKLYLSYFIQETCDALRLAETSLLQGQLFD